MTPRENHLAREYPHQLNAKAFKRALVKLREPLTSLYAQAYLLKRRLQQEQIGQECLDDLTAITHDAR